MAIILHLGLNREMKMVMCPVCKWVAAKVFASGIPKAYVIRVSKHDSKNKQ